MKEADEYYEDEKPAGKRWQFPFAVGFAILVAVAFIVVVYIVPPGPVLKPFTENFRSASEDTLEMRGWSVRKKDTAYWKRRDENAGHLTLFTLKENPGFRNLVVRKIEGDCFVTEVRLSDFVPKQNGQQAGIILMEDADLSGRSLSFSVSYSDFSGEQIPEIIVQAITSEGKGSKPRHSGYKRLFVADSAFSEFEPGDLKKVAIRIVKNGKKFTFLYATAPVETYSFKEAFSQEFAIEPKYIALYASGSAADSAVVMPALFDHFSFVPDKCGKIK